MNCWKRSIFRFFFVCGAVGRLGGGHGRESVGGIGGGVVSILLMEELLLSDVTDEDSVLMLLLEDPLLVVDGEELAVSSTDQGVEIEFLFRFIRCVRS